LSSSGLNNPPTVTSDTTTLTVLPATISIDSQPTNTTTADTFASFSVAASINPSYATLTYQWQLSTNSGVSFSNISGATTSTLSLSNLTTANTGNLYRVVVSGNGGASPVESSSATLIVNAPEITITAHPQDTISQNASATFSVSATIDGRTTPYLLSYSWERSSDGGLTFVSIPGATGSSYTINNITKSLDNYLYDVRVSSNIGSAPVFSNLAKLSVNDNYGALFVWGSNSSSQLNAVTGSTTNIPKYTNRTTSIYRSSSFGQNHGLFINASGILETYGINTLGQTAGNGRVNIYGITTKYNHNLALSERIEEIAGLRLYSWGANSFGQCGLGNTSSAVTAPTLIPNDNNSYMDIAVGENHSLAVRDNGMMVACGRNDVGQLGIGNNNSQTTFVTVSGNIDQVSCGQSHSAAITANGILYTWGNNANGQLGLGDTSPRNNPTAVSGTAWTQVVCGQNFTAALNTSNELYTWGSNAQGQLGINSNVDSNIPVKVGNMTWKNISAGNLHMLGVSTDNQLYSWGNGAQSQIGNALAVNSLVPIKIGENPDDQWESVSAGGNSSSAIRRGAIISITSHPTNTESRDGSASFSVAATITAGGLLSYQWQVSTDSGTTWSNLAGSTSSTLTLSSLNTSSDGYRYRCAISGTEGAYTLYSDSAILVEKSATIYYRGTNDGSNSIGSNNPGGVAASFPATWTQWNQWNISSSAVNVSISATPIAKPANTTVKQFVRVGLNGTAFLLSDGSVIGFSANAAANTTYDFNTINSAGGSFRFANPAGEKIVKLIGNYGTYTASLLYGRTFLWGISESGKLYGIAPSGANYGGTPNVWNRIGSSLVISDAAACAHNGTFLPTVFAIAVDGTLWAWGDNRLINSTTAGTPSFNNAPVRINTDVWTAIAGNMGGFYGIKSDGAVYRLAGVWNGGAVSGRNGANTTTFNSGTVAATVNSNPTLIDNSVAYTRLAANGTILIGYDINNKLHINPNFNTPRNLPLQWNNISNILLGTNSAAQGAVILTDNYTSVSVNNIALITAAATPLYYEYGATSLTTTYSSTSAKPWGTGTSTSPVTVPEASARFNYVIPDFPGYYIALKDD
jgi:alpha-tubulin suppressor-like RCC1 family protein